MFSNKYKRKAKSGTMLNQEEVANVSPPVLPFTGLDAFCGIMDLDNNSSTENIGDTTKRSWNNANPASDMGSTASSNRSSASATPTYSGTPSPTRNSKRFKWLFDERNYDPMDTTPSPTSPVELVEFTRHPFDDFKKPFATSTSVSEQSDPGKKIL